MTTKFADKNSFRQQDLRNFLLQENTHACILKSLSWIADITDFVHTFMCVVIADKNVSISFTMYVGEA